MYTFYRKVEMSLKTGVASFNFQVQVHLVKRKPIKEKWSEEMLIQDIRKMWKN